MHCPGPDEEQCAYRSELVGILCSILHVLATLDYDTTIKGSGKIHCDCKGALEAIKNRYAIAEPNRPHYDIIQAIWKIQDETNIKWTLKHVKGHQDANLSVDKLTREEQLNIEADAIAKTYAHQLQGLQASTPITTLPFQRLKIKYEGKIIGGRFKKRLRQACSSNRIQKYWNSKKRIPRSLHATIDWQLLNKTYTSLPLHQRWKLGKWKTHFCGVGKTLQDRRYQHYSSCPFCLSPQEDTRHVLQCSHPVAKQIWDDNLVKIHKWMLNNKGDPDMVQNIIGRINA